ncbi:MAG: hypothetical protein ACRDU0_00350, partial [Mycobacterium sp.]
GEEAKFTFTGTPKPAEPVEPDLAKAGAHSAGEAATAAE